MKRIKHSAILPFPLEHTVSTSDDWEEWKPLYQFHQERVYEAMYLSPDVYREFIFPYHQELLSYFGGGAIHSCGRVVPYEAVPEAVLWFRDLVEEGF